MLVRDHGALEDLQHQPRKMVKHTRTIRRQIV